MARRRGMIRYGSFAEVTHGIVKPKAWVIDKIRRWLWGIVLVSLYAVTMTTLTAIGQALLADLFNSLAVASVITKITISLIQLLMVSFTAVLLWGMHQGSQTTMPTFSAKIPRFEPRPPPDFEAGETWDDWLRKGVRIGRWQGAVGSLEPGEIAWMQVIDTHPLIAAETRMGKSTALWALLWELKPAIDAGVVEVIMFDPKVGMEMAAAVRLGLIKSTERFGRDHGDEIDHFFYGQGVGGPDPNHPERWLGKRYEDTWVEPLEHQVFEMRDRAAEVRESGAGQHVVASQKRPWRFVVVDEGASIIRQGANPTTRQRIISAFLNLGDQGAGAGYTLVVCTQHPDMKRIPFRHALTSGLCGLVKTWEAVEMVLGRGSYGRGAYGDQLDPNIPGVFFMSRKGAWQLRVQDAKPKFTPKPRGGGLPIEDEVPIGTEPSNEELATIHQLRRPLPASMPDREYEHVRKEATG